MSYPVHLLALLAVASLAGCATSSHPTSTPVVASRAELKPLDEARLNEAKMLKEDRRYLEAAAIYAEQARLQPENAELVARQAHLFSSQAREESNPARAKELFRRARALAEQAEKLGTDDPLTPMILAGVQPDGSTREMAKGDFSQHERADRLMREGEAAFTLHDFPKARECYQQAYELEPTNYMAALWTGDAYFAARQLESACEWFRKAVAIEPDNETAHRYLGDALAKLGRREDALSEYIAALLCEPYQRLTRQHFGEEMRARAVARGRSIPRFPLGRFSVDLVKKEIGVDSDADNVEAVYAIACASWRIDQCSTQGASATGARRCLEEEIAGLELLIATQEAVLPEESPETDVKLKTEHATWRPIIAGLVALRREGLLEAYAFFERADAELAMDYTSYRAAHRDKLERYVRVYWCGFE